MVHLRSTPGWIPHRNKLLQSASHNIVFTPVWIWRMALPSFQTAALYLCFKQLAVCTRGCVWHLFFPNSSFGRSDTQGGSDSFVSKQLCWEVWHLGWVWHLSFFPNSCFGRSDIQGGSDSFVSKQLCWEVWHLGWVWHLFFQTAVLGGLTSRVGLTALFPNSCVGRSDIQGGSDSFVFKQLFWEDWHPGWVWQFCFQTAVLGGLTSRVGLTALFQMAELSISNSWHFCFKQPTSPFQTADISFLNSSVYPRLGLTHIHTVLNSCIHPWQG